MKGSLIRAAWQKERQTLPLGESGWGADGDCDSRWECLVGITCSIRAADAALGCLGTQDVWLLGKGRNRHEMADIRPLKGCQVEGGVDSFYLLVEEGARKRLWISV